MGKQKDFVAISMLCMYPNRATVCSVALVKVKNNEVVDEYHTLVSPPAELKFEGFNMAGWHHGISEAHTEGKPTFIEVLPLMEQFIEGFPLVVHNGITEHWAFVRSLEYFRGAGVNVSSYLENERLIDTSRMYDSVPFYKEYDALKDARKYAEFYISQDADDVLYPLVKVKKRPDVTQEYMAAVKRKEKVAPEVYEEFDYSLTKHPDNYYFGLGLFVTGEAGYFASKTDLYLCLRNELGLHPCKSVSAKQNNILVVCERGFGAARIEKATKAKHIIMSEEELFEELKSMGIEVPESPFLK